MKRYEKNAAVIFDAEEPIGTPTDLVMPRRRWFRKANRRPIHWKQEFWKHRNGNGNGQGNLAERRRAHRADQITPREVEQVERALIDASTRVPVLMFYTSADRLAVARDAAGGFHFVQTARARSAVGTSAVLTWGRMRPAHLNVMLYGWASMAGMGTAIWLMARLVPHDLASSAAARYRRRHFGISVCFLELCGILAGDSTGYEWLEFPGLCRGRLFSLPTRSSMSWAVLMFRFRRGDHDLHHAMVFARRVSLVPVALRRPRRSCFSSFRCRA